MLKTVLHGEHLKLNAKMVEFSGWHMPVLYSSIVEEHTATRTKAGLFDVSHMVEFRLRGAGCGEFLKRIVPTSIDKLSPRKSMYTLMCNEQGGVVDDIFIYMIHENEYYIVSNADTHVKDLKWLQRQVIADVEIVDESPFTTKLDLQGPASRDILKRVIPDDRLDRLERFCFDTFDYQGEKLMISQSGYTGEYGFELYIHNDLAADIWNGLLEQGEDLGIKPVGLGARDTLRLESCLSLYGHELSDSISPVEAGLKWLVNSDAAYVGRKALQEQIERGPGRQMIVFEITDKGIPRNGFLVYNGGQEIGYVTSGTFSPTFKKGIGMALVARDSLQRGDHFSVGIRDKMVDALVVPRPLYKYNALRVQV
ncbi:MAG TPA: glycine cleavage system aminomethyltransferase GcvT [Spirochaetota bacterium]|nr:glycine cleavage system aminomethyltransferase GcvT [Spirochaetota bacterium]